jgi:hypothetical protein
MSGRITDRIGFRLDNTPAQPARVRVMDDDLTNQVASQLHGINGKLGSTEAPHSK